MVNKKTVKEDKNSLGDKLEKVSKTKEFTNKEKEEIKQNFVEESVVVDENFQENEESKEKTEKLPKLQRENHKIDKELSVKEKLDKGRKKETVPAYINGTDKKVTVIKKQIEGANADAFVWEYIEDKAMPKNMVGEQLFNRNAVLNL
jgi:hypothetical protein